MYETHEISIFTLEKVQGKLTVLTQTSVSFKSDHSRLPVVTLG